MKLARAALILLALSLPLSAMEVDAHIGTVMNYQDLRDDTHLNPDGVFERNDIEARAEGRVRFRTDIGETVKAMLDLDFTYAPIRLDPTAPFDPLRIRELYTDVQTDLFALKVGRQFLKWGSSEYFNPLDIVNVSRADLISSESEGNFFVNLNIPVGTWMSLEAMTLVKDDLEEFSDLPVVGKISVSVWQISSFLFGYFQDGKKPTGGLDFILSIPFAEGVNASLYSETLLRQESDRRYYTKSGGLFASHTLPDDIYPAVVAGLRTDVSFATVRGLDGLKAVAEYYYDAENWNGNRLGAYFDYLDAVKTDPAAFGALLSDYRPFKNSRHYLYGSLSLVGLFWKDFQADCSLIMNLTDKSSVVIPQLSYLFNSGNTACGLKALVNSGDEDSEFANSDYTWRFELYARTSF